MLKGRNIVLFVLYALVLAFVNAFPEQSDFELIFIGYTSSFLLLLLLVKQIDFDGLDQRQMIFMSLVSLPMVVIFPNLSDDVYRFVWDGYCSINGISPYEFRPSELVSKGIHGLDQGLFEKLNSPEYYSIYPTLSQLLFAFSTWVTDSLVFQSSILKFVYWLLFLIGNLCLLHVLKRHKLLKSGILFYVLNPLVLIEGIGNLHAEVNMVSLLFIALYLFDRKKDLWSAFVFALAISVKLIPLFLLGYFLLRWRDVRCRRYLISTLFFTLILFVPVLNGVFSGGFEHSVDLYFRKFEFNASIYYILGSVGFGIFGYNIIAFLGPLLFIAFVVMNFFWWYQNRFETSISHFTNSGLKTFALYFLISTIVHPWYVIGLLAFNIISQYKFVWIWAYLITLTYINYSYATYHENLWIVVLEYVIVFLALYYDWRKKKFIVSKELLK